MKTLDEIYAEVLVNEELKARFQALNTAEEQAALVKELGGEASAEEIAEYLAKKNNRNGELTDEELEQVAGGKVSDDAKPYHSNCGGAIVSRSLNLLESEFYCKQCGETHTSLNGFLYYWVE